MKPIKGLALASSSRLMWAHKHIVFPVIFVNALAQSLIIYARELFSSTLANTFLAILSFIVLLVSLGLVISSLIQKENKPTWDMTIHQLKRHGLRFVLWGLGYTTVVTFTYSWGIYPGIILIILTPYVLIAAMEGERNALYANFKAIIAYPFRWILLVALMLMFGTVSFFLAGATTFFVRGFAASLITWVIAGIAITWVIGAFVTLKKYSPVGEKSSLEKTSMS